MSEEKKVAVVTGASRGIGKAIASQLGKDFLVVGTATTAAGAESISQYFAEQSMVGIGLPLDVTDKDSLTTFVSQVNEAHGAPLVLINNAAVTRDNILLRMKEDEWETVLETNLTAVYRLTKIFLKGMTKARWGRIINISSVVGNMGNAGQSNYAATKAGLLGFAKSLAREVGSRNITVNTIAPGFIDTDMTRSLADAQKETLLTQIPLGRLGEPEEIAAVVAFLAGPAGGYITGETIHVNGGMYMA
ncbi:MAG: 3-oxoacyl-ACP reductase FabG [Pseudomonadales bacterium]